ncbi:MAG: hypothetical protein LBI59_01235, partial [Candidatus Accumulibacter sp.]|nr:hypothetical protein [Accumulibacter sp.]
RFRWLLVVLVALSLIASRRVQLEWPFASVSQEGVWMLALATVSPAEDGASSTAEIATDVAECGDTRSSDYPHEMDQILSLFSPHWGTDVAQWGGVYCANPSSGPVFSIDRPPKTAPRAA